MRVNRVSLLAFGLVLAAVGCQPPAKDAPKQSNVTASNEQPPTQSPPATAPKPGTPDIPSPKEIREGLERINPSLKPVPKGQDKWTASQQKALDLAAQVEQSMRQLSKVRGMTVADVEFEGGRGASAGTLQIESPKRFSVEYVRLLREPLVTITKETLIADGTHVATRTPTLQWSDRKPLQQLSAEAQLTPERWVAEFPRALLTAIGGAKPITALVESASRAGLEVTAENRSIKGRDDRQVYQKRILITRKADPKKKVGELMIELVIDGTRHLPVTVRTSHEAPNKPPTRILWTTRWEKPAGLTFPPQEFKIGKPTGTQRA